MAYYFGNQVRSGILGMSAGMPTVGQIAAAQPARRPELPEYEEVATDPSQRKKPWANALLHAGSGLLEAGDWSGLGKAKDGILEAQEFNLDLEERARAEAERRYSRNMDRYRADMDTYRDERNFGYREGRDAVDDGRWNQQFAEGTRRFDLGHELDKQRVGFDGRRVVLAEGADKRAQELHAPALAAAEADATKAERDARFLSVAPGTGILDFKGGAPNAVYTQPFNPNTGERRQPLDISPSDLTGLRNEIASRLPAGSSIDPSLMQQVLDRASQYYQIGRNSGVAVEQAMRDALDYGEDGSPTVTGRSSWYNPFSWGNGDPRVSGRPQQQTNTGTGGQSGAQSPQQDRPLVQPKSEAEHAALPPGTRYLDPQGNIRIKGQ